MATKYLTTGLGKRRTPIEPDPVAFEYLEETRPGDTGRRLGHLPALHKIEEGKRVKRTYR